MRQQVGRYWLEGGVEKFRRHNYQQRELYLNQLAFPLTVTVLRNEFYHDSMRSVLQLAEGFIFI